MCLPNGWHQNKSFWGTYVRGNSELLVPKPGGEMRANIHGAKWPVDEERLRVGRKGTGMAGEMTRAGAARQVTI